MQAPLAQTFGSPHATSQAPQWRPSVLVSTHSLPHGVRPPGHVNACGDSEGEVSPSTLPVQAPTNTRLAKADSARATPHPREQNDMNES